MGGIGDRLRPHRADRPQLRHRLAAQWRAPQFASTISELSGRPATFARSGPDANTPSAFAGAWADLARDKANAKGAFASAIPKPNLAKVLGL